MFEDDEELKEKQRIQKIVTIIFALGIIISVAGIITWNTIKPLPNVKACQEAGYPAGEIIKNVTICHAACENNKITSCERIRVLH